MCPWWDSNPHGMQGKLQGPQHCQCCASANSATRAGTRSPIRIAVSVPFLLTLGSYINVSYTLQV